MSVYGVTLFSKENLKGAIWAIALKKAALAGGLFKINDFCRSDGA